MIGALDVPLGEMESQIQGLLGEGFHVAWADHHDLVYLRVWEYPGPEPAWLNVFSEKSLADVNLR